MFFFHKASREWDAVTEMCVDSGPGIRKYESKTFLLRRSQACKEKKAK